MKEGIVSRIFDVFNYIFVGLLCLATVYPFLDILQVSLSAPSMVLPSSRIHLAKWLITASAEMYSYIFSFRQIRLGYLNSFIQTGLSTIIALITCSLAAYPLSKKRLLARNYVTIYIAVTMFFSGGMIPSYLLINSLGMIDTLWSIIIPGAFSVWNMIIMRTFFQNIPDEMEEAAQIEGANDLYILFRIYIPLSKALFATMTLFFAVGFWNSWFNALIYLKNQDLFPLQLALRNFLIENTNLVITSKFSGGFFRGAEVNSDSVRDIFRAAVMIVAILPLVIMYPFVQKYFVKGVMIGSIKG